MTTNINVTEQTTTVTTVDDVTTITLANAGVQGIPGVGYTGVTSASTITIGSGLKTFTLVAGYAGAFITGMRIRAIHSDTPTYYLEGTANYVGAGTLILTVDKFNGSGSHNSWAFASAGEVGQTGATGATGASGVVSVTSPITNTGSASSAIVGIDQTLLSITRSQVADFTSGTVASAGTAQQSGTAVYAVNSGTAVYSTTSGTAVNISGTVTQSQVTNLTTDLAAKAPLASPTFTGNVTVTLPFSTSGIISQLNGLLSTSAAAPGLGYFPYTASSSGGYAWQDLALVARTNVANTFTAANTFNADLSVSATGSSTATPRILGITDLTTGTSARLQFGDYANNLQTRNGGRLQLNAYWGIDIRGNGQFVSAPSFTAGAATDPGVSIFNSQASAIGAVIRGAASQSANLQEWQNSAGTAIASISSAGQFNSTVGIIGGGAAQATNARNTFYTAGTASIGLVVQGAASQSANLQEWQNSGGTVRASVSSAGYVYGVGLYTNGSEMGFETGNGGGRMKFTRCTSLPSNQGANQAIIYFRDGTNAGTLKLVVRAGASGAETTILDNIPQT
jgi:hypothetical protein